MKASVGGMLSSLKPQQAQQDSPRGGQPPGDSAGPMAAGAAAGGGFSGVERSVGSGGGAPPPLASLDDQQGQPVKVQVRILVLLSTSMPLYPFAGLLSRPLWAAGGGASPYCKPERTHLMAVDAHIKQPRSCFVLSCPLCTSTASC